VDTKYGPYLHCGMAPYAPELTPCPDLLEPKQAVYARIDLAPSLLEQFDEIVRYLGTDR
jgi:hypothetical protein